LKVSPHESVRNEVQNLLIELNKNDQHGNHTNNAVDEHKDKKVKVKLIIYVSGFIY
jgi:hypothetical protein